MNTKLISTLLILITAAVLQAQTSASKAPALESAKLGATRNVHAAGELFLAGQFTPEDLTAIKAQDIKRIITLRAKDELKWNEKAAVEGANIGFFSVPILNAGNLTDDVFDTVRRLLRGRGKTLLHCRSANRVAGVWIAFRVLDQGVALEVAVAEAKRVGLRKPALEQKARDYVARVLARTGGVLSVKPGITCTWQVSGRSLISFEQWMMLDLEYVHSWSLARDFVILMKTVPAVLSMRGSS